jgi:hypothetical protein
MANPISVDPRQRRRALPNSSRLTVTAVAPRHDGQNAHRAPIN